MYVFYINSYSEHLEFLKRSAKYILYVFSIYIDIEYEKSEYF